MKDKKSRERAYNAVAAAKRKGDLKPEPCSACGAKAEAHHNDYDKPLEVVWLCRKHHRLIDSSKFVRKTNTREHKSKTPGGKTLIM